MLKINKLNSVMQITQNDIKHVAGAQIGMGLMWALSLVGSNVIVAAVAFTCFKLKHAQYMIKVRRCDEFYNL